MCTKVRVRAARPAGRASVSGVLSLWKLRVGAEAYYLAQVARGLDDYYTGQGEVPGVWIGNASLALGLTGEVDPEDLRAVLAGLAPGIGLTPNGHQLRTHRRRVPGFDLTFSVPKSVSVVYALGDPLVRAEVVAAGEAALASTIAWLEREACHVRRGTNNRSAKVADIADWGTRRLPGAGFVAAAFRHRVSRAGDPQLHWHVLVANITRGPDGRWTALDATSVYRTKRAAGVAFEAALRAELTRRLGVAWLPTVKDSADIAGIPTRILRLFSKRRQQIENELARTGTTGPAAAAQATLATRDERGSFDPDGIEASWHAQALAAGWGADHLDRLLAHPTGPATEPALDDLVAIVARRLIDTDSTFTRHDITQAVAAALPNGADLARVDQLTAGVVAHPDLVPLRHERAAGWEQRYTTRQLLAIEAGLVATVANRTSAPVAALSEERIAVAVRNATSLGPDQQAAVIRLLAQGNPVEVLVGRAGTGKTFTLATIAAAYQQAGYHPIGVAPSARAARELADGTGLAAFTVPRYHHAIARDPLSTQSIVIVDEAGMCGTIDLHSVLSTARAAGAKVILVGDHYQLPEVAAGGGFRTAVTLLGDQVGELTINRRVTEPWETLALDELRHGNITAAWNAYRTHGRVTVTDDHTDIRTLVIEDWWAAHRRGERTFLLAGTRAETVLLNSLARQRAAAAGLLHGPSLETNGRVFQAGDRVLLTHNDTHQTGLNGTDVRVDNGTLATITLVHPDRTLTIAFDNGRPPVQLRQDYINAGWVQHGYAMTIHKSQGATCDKVFVVGPAGLYREAAYVAMSRARHGAWLYATTSQAAYITEPGHSAGIPLPDEADDAEHTLLAVLERSEAKHLALTTTPFAAAAADLAREPLAELHRQLGHIRHVHATLADAGMHDPTTEQRSLTYAATVRATLTVGGRVRALDRDNVGRVDAIHDHEGSATVTFTSAGGRSATRTLDWTELKTIDHPSPQPTPADAGRWLADRQAELDQRTRRWSDALSEHGLTAESKAVIEAAIAIRTTRVFEALIADPPPWLHWWIGQRPADPIGATTWDDNVHRIATWRDLHQTPENMPGLGHVPTNSAEADAWFAAMSHILRARTWLAGRTPQPEPIAVRPLQGAALIDRIAELDRLLDTAPPDCRHLIDGLLGGNVDPAHLHDALVHAHEAQTARREWILTNWPHVVERQQLSELIAKTDPMAHWPQSTTEAVQRAFDQLRETVPPPQTPEHRTLQLLTSELSAADPEELLATLAARVAQLRECLRALEASLPAEPPERRSLTYAEIIVRRQELNHAVAGLATAQADTHRTALHETELDDLHDSVRRRVEQLVYDAISLADPWLLDELGRLDSIGTLPQLDTEMLYRHLASAAAKRELPDVSTPAPTLSIP